jgi:hypothetical protein
MLWWRPMLVAGMLDSVTESQWGNHEIHETHEKIAIRKRHRNRGNQLNAADQDLSANTASNASDDGESNEN